MLNIVRICANRIFGDKTKGQKMYNSTIMIIKVSQMFQRNKLQQTAINSVNKYKIKIMQWNCRCLYNKIPDLLVFLKKKHFDIVCLYEVKSWHTGFGDFGATKTTLSKSHGSIIFADNFAGIGNN